MYVLGIDIGSISAKAVAMNESKTVLAFEVLPSGYETNKTAHLLRDAICTKLGIISDDIAYSVTTGYSRKNVDFSDKQVTEISCQAKGVHYLFPLARTVIDIGGQDSKAIRIDDQGILQDFEMNDKCSAGTGRFLEVMARTLDVPLEMMADHSSKEYVQISSTCTVFAESEVVSRIAQGAERGAIVGGIHRSIAIRVKSLVQRIGIENDVILTGGVAKNEAVVEALSEELNVKLTVPEEPQITAAIGAALLAIKNSK
ncbi:MAG: 2-hydroxyglutaryl-CoA dehydratase [Candidatus Heimdallarchaeota archaeon]|nr:2-hydroxyglutaryl-CoA dehydratase [Candidatus Heimdallarchaeota archaeon]